MYFTQKGKCYWMRVYEIPEGTKTSKGRAIQNLINIESDDKVKAFYLYTRFKKRRIHQQSLCDYGY